MRVAMDDKGNNERRRPKFKKVDKHSGIPAYVQVMNQVKTEVILGRLVPGDQLPPVRELETMFDVNVNTILKALDKLKSEGVLSSEQGVGYFVTSNIAIESSIIDELGEFVRKIKNVGLDLYTTILLIEEVWKMNKASFGDFEYNLTALNAYLRKEFVEKFRTLFIFFVIMLFPGLGPKILGTFFIIVFSMGSDIRSKKLDMMTFLPFSKEMIYWYEFIFVLLLVVLSFFIGLPFVNGTLLEAFSDLLGAIIFAAAYYGLVMIVSMLGMDPIGGAFLILILDSIFSSFGTTQLSESFNPYKLISPIAQENQLAALIFAVICLYIGSVMFSKRGGEK